MKACGCGNFYDQPDDDGTDAAHPAYWRGHDRAVEFFLSRLLTDVANGTIPMRPASGDTNVQRAVNAIVSLRGAYEAEKTMADAAVTRVKELEEQLAQSACLKCGLIQPCKCWARGGKP